MVEEVAGVSEAGVARAGVSCGDEPAHAIAGQVHRETPARSTCEDDIRCGAHVKARLQVLDDGLLEALAPDRVRLVGRAVSRE